MGSLTDLKTVFKNINFLPWNEYLFLPKDKNWSLDSLCSIINWDAMDEEEIGDDGDTPIFATDNNLIYVFDIATVQDIVDNAKQQLPEPTEAQLFEAFMYYFNNDAFISFE
ncbi:DUF7716 domain-containing protein [Robertmurraya korlensis]|uniref:DUF7716 domain-containing protein n=1 Tax=Robertmurraya korlensis TaxID=519977 RepID=UPI00082437BA|nr:hypothetical protein [Robertmurraya korlensis]